MAEIPNLSNPNDDPTTLKLNQITDHDQNVSEHHHHHDHHDLQLQQKHDDDQDDEDDNDEENYAYAMQITELLPFPMVMQAAVELDLLGILARGGPLTAAELAAALPGASRNPDAPDMLDRMLFLLATHSVVTCTTTTMDGGGVVRKYGLAPVGKYFVPNKDGVSLGAVLSLNQHLAFVASWICVHLLTSMNWNYSSKTSNSFYMFHQNLGIT